MMAETRLPGIPDVSGSQIPIEVKRAILALAARSLIREGEYRNGDSLDRVMTFRDAVTLSLIDRSASGFTASAAAAIGAASTIVEAGTDGSAGEDLTVPPAIDGLDAVGGYSTVFITFTQPSYNKSGSSESNHAYTEIYRADALGGGGSPGFAAAVAIGQTSGAFLADPVGGFGQTYYYWARNFSRADQPGPVAGGTDGIQVVMPVQLEVYMDVLEQAAGPFVVYDVPTIVNGQLVPAGVYMRQAFIQNGTVNRLHVDLTTTNKLFAVDATFGTVLADTIKVLNANVAGTIQSDDFISGSSGWRITKTRGGTAEFNNLVARGTILGGAATGFSTGVGLFAGDVSGTYKFRLGNPSGAKVEWDGTTLTGSFSTTFTQYGDTTFVSPTLVDMSLVRLVSGTQVWYTDAGDDLNYGHSDTDPTTGTFNDLASSAFSLPSSSTASSWTSETFPLSAITSAQFQVAYSLSNHSGTATAKLQTKQLIGDAWTDHALSGGGSDTVTTTARYARLLFETTGVMQVTGYPTMTVFAPVQIEEYEISTSALATTTINLAGTYSKVKVSLHYESTTPLIVQVESTNLGAGTIDVGAWDASTLSRVAQDVTVTIQGV